MRGFSVRYAHEIGTSRKSNFSEAIQNLMNLAEFHNFTLMNESNLPPNNAMYMDVVKVVATNMSAVRFLGAHLFPMLHQLPKRLYLQAIL
jgi:hypothetical protein